MFNKAEKIREKYIREEMWPSIFCTGCGIGNVLSPGIVYRQCLLFLSRSMQRMPSFSSRRVEAKWG